MKISNLFVALLLGMTAMTACQNDAPQSATPPATTETAPSTAVPQDNAASAPMQDVAAPTVTPQPQAQPQVVPQGQAAPTMAAPQPVAAGMNPAHGQPGHRCDIAVGAPLNSKPMPKPQ